MTSDGVNSYTWDRANRLLTWDNGVAADLVNHAYDGEGRRVSQAVGTTSPTITKYLLDIQPGLAVVLSQTEGSDVTRFVHAPRGIHARQDASNDWHWTVQDGLGTVRIETNNSVAVEGSQNFDPYGNLIDMVNGDIDTPYGFTGEQTDTNGQVYLRARYYNPNIGVFSALDPFEGIVGRPMSLNGYSWVEGNVPNAIDPSGAISIPSGLELALAMNSACSVVLQTPTPSSCKLTDLTDAIASFGRQEANQEGSQLFPTAAAIALAEINYLNAGNTPRARSTTYYSSTKYVSAADSTKIRGFVSKYVEGSCNGKLVDAVNQQSSAVPELTAYSSDLEFIARNPTIAYEHSFIADNRSATASSSDYSGVKPGERLGSDFVTNMNKLREEFKFRVFTGTVHSVVVSNDFSPIPFEWNCTVNGNQVVNSGYNPNSDLDPVSGLPNFIANSSCVPKCNKSLWWWKPPTTATAKQYAKDFYSQFNPQYKDGDTWIKIPNSDGTSHDYQSAIQLIGGTGYVASCS